MLLVAPVASASSESVHFNQPLSGNVSAADGDADSLTASVVLDPLHGSVTFNADGSFSYLPDTNFVGVDAFDFLVNDGSDDSNVATVTISVTNTNPTTSGSSGSTEFNTPLIGAVFGTDADNDSLTASLVSEPLHGLLTLSSDGSFVYAPDIDFAGMDSFEFHFTDGAAASNLATFSITIFAGPSEEGGTSGGGGSEPLNPAELALQTQLNALQQARETTVSGLLSTLSGVVTAANGVYDSALSVAQTQLQIDLGTYVGNATMYELDDFAWPDAPESDVLDFPEDSEQPELPGERPTYSGDEYDFSTDSVYQLNLAGIDTDYVDDVAAAEAVYLAATTAASLSFDQVIEAAKQQRLADIAIANQNAATFASAPHPTINLDVATFAAQQASQAAQTLYEATVYPPSPQLLQEPHIELGKSLAAAEVVGAAAYAAVWDAPPPPPVGTTEFELTMWPYRPAMSAYWLARAPEQVNAYEALGYYIADIIRQSAEDNADALLLRDTTLHAIDLALQTQIWQVAAWTEAHQLGAATIVSLGLTQALSVEAVAVANATNTRDDQWADAVRDRQIAIAAAKGDQVIARATLTANTLQNWNTLQPSNWSQYQSDLAANALTYVTNVTLVQVLDAAVQADEQYDERSELAQHARDSAVTMAGAEAARASATINADAGLRLAENTEKWNATIAAESDYRDMRDAHAVADWRYTYDVVAADWLQLRSKCDEDNDHLLALANIEATLYLSGVTTPLPADVLLYDAAIVTANNAHRDGLADVLHDYQYDTIAAEAARAASKVGANYDYRTAVNELEATAQLNVATQAESFAFAKANAQYAFALADATQLETQQKADAQSLRDRLANVALTHESTANIDSALSAARRIDDATARHLFESSEAGDEAALLAAWDLAENTPWSEYQADLAASTFDFVDQVGQDVVADVTASANADDSWQQGANLLNREYDTAIADAARVRADDAATHARELSYKKAYEIWDRYKTVATETKWHDRAFANATWDLEDHVALYDAIQQGQQNSALWGYKRTVADKDCDLTKTVILQSTRDTDVQSAFTLRLSLEGAALVTRTNNVGIKQVAWTAATNLADLIWTNNVDTAFNLFATNVRNSMVNDYAADEQTSDNTLASSNATAEYNRTLGFLPLDIAYGTDLTNADTLWSSSLDDDLSDYREGLVDHWGEYEEGLYTAHYDAQQAEFTSSSDPLDGYQASYAQTEMQLATAMRTQRNTYHADVTTANQTYTDNRNAKRLLDLPLQQAADTLATNGRATQSSLLTIGTGAAYALQTHDGTVADADRFQADVFSETSYSNTAIGQRNSNRLNQANHNRTWANNVALATSTLHQAQYSDSAATAFESTKATETALRKFNVRTTNLTRIGNIGTTQTTRGTSLGNNEIAQVTTYGNADVTLSGSLTTSEDSFDSAVQTIETTHRATTLSLWTGDQLHDATQQQLRTSSLGQAGVDFLNNLRPSLLSSATNLANAETLYRLSLATTAANEAAAVALSAATPAAQFLADAATIKLTWLQQMAPQFATFVNASAIAEANASRDSAIAERDFNNNAAVEEFNYVTAVVPLMTGLANASATNNDTLHNNLSDASQAHRLTSSTAGQTHGIGGSTANKQHRIDRAGNRQSYETAQENADQDATAGETTFLTSEADAELTRAAGTTGVAETDKTWRYDLAAADKTETRDSATAQKTYQQTQAGLQQSFDNNEALASGNYDLAVAGHEQTYGNATLAADIARATALGNAQLAWLNATYAADLFALTQLDTLNNDAGDWTTHLMQLATAKQTWWTTFSPNFTSFINDVTNEWATEQTTANTELSDLATVNNTADLAYAADRANATFQSTTFLADQSEQREFVIADADELFQQAEADARNGYDVTKATLTRDISAPSTPLLPGVTLSQAITTQTNARAAAKQTFDNATVLPVAAFSVTEEATNYWLMSETNSLASAQSAARATALDNFLTNTSNASLTRRQNVASLASNFAQSWSSSQATALSAFALTNPSPWATFAVEKANAEVSRTNTLAPARATHESGMAQADHDFISGLATSLAQYVNDQTTFDNEDAASLADYDLSSAINAANAFLNPSDGDTYGGGSFVDVMTAVSVPGATSSGPPSDFTYNADAPTPDSTFYLAMPNSIRRSPPTFSADYTRLRDDHVEPATPSVMPRGTMPQGHSATVVTVADVSNVGPRTKKEVEKPTAPKLPMNPDEMLAGEPDNVNLSAEILRNRMKRLQERIPETVEGPSGTMQIQYEPTNEGAYVGSVQMLIGETTVFVGWLRYVKNREGNVELCVFHNGKDIPLQQIILIFQQTRVPEDQAGWDAFFHDYKPKTLTLESWKAHRLNVEAEIKGAIILGALHVSSQVAEEAALNGGMKIGLKLVGGVVKRVIKDVERNISRRELKRLADQVGEKIDVHNPTAQQLERLEKKINAVLGKGSLEGEPYSLALGLTRHPAHGADGSGLLMRFADKVDDTNVRHYWQLIDQRGLPNATVGKQLERQLLGFMTEAKHLHLNLDGMLDTLDADKLKELLKLGEQGTRFSQNITRWEFFQVWSKFRNKATFYFDGKAVDLSNLLN